MQTLSRQLWRRWKAGRSQARSQGSVCTELSQAMRGYRAELYVFMFPMFP